MYGPKGKIGLLVPAGNRVIIPEFYRISPPGIAFFETRMIVQGSWVSEESNFSMIEQADQCLEVFRLCRVDLCVMACTATSFLKGRDWDRSFISEAEKKVGIPVTTTATSIVQSLGRLGVRRLAMASPWTADVNARAVRYLQESGFEVVNSYSKSIDRFKVNDQLPEFAYHMALEADVPDAEAVCIFATDLRTIEILSPLEEKLGKPVVSSNQAILFNALKILKYDQGIRGFGKLLESI